LLILLLAGLAVAAAGTLAILLVKAGEVDRQLKELDHRLLQLERLEKLHPRAQV
jgi:hypothetical protein